MQVHNKNVGQLTGKAGPVVERKSLNKEARKKTLIKIAQENQAILKRLQDKQASYQTGQFSEEYKHKERILRNICEYPLALSKGKRELSVDGERAVTAFQEPGGQFGYRSRAQTGNPAVTTPMQSTHYFHNAALDQRRFEQFNPKRILDAQRQILYKSKRKLTPGEYLIELSLYNK